eukprot:767330-Hanusia_phi.AAC.10
MVGKTGKESKRTEKRERERLKVGGGKSAFTQERVGYKVGELADADGQDGRRTQQEMRPERDRETERQRDRDREKRYTARIREGMCEEKNEQDPYNTWKRGSVLVDNMTFLQMEARSQRVSGLKDRR